MRVDQLLLTIHILAVATWIGAAMAMQVLAKRMGPSTDAAVVDQFARDAEAVGKYLFGPSAVLLLVTGVALVVRQDISWGELWVVLGLGAVIAAGAVGGAFLIPEGRHIALLADQQATIRPRSRRAPSAASSSHALTLPSSSSRSPSWSSNRAAE